MMSHALILGGSGFFGKSILEAYKKGLLRQQGIDKISIVSRRASNLKTSHPDLLDQSIHLFDADVTNCDTLPSADLIIHAAASADAARYALHPEEEKKNILYGVRHFCDLARTIFQDSKIVFVSSGAVYGAYPPEIQRIDEDYVFNSEDQIEESKHIYASAKQECEVLIERLGSTGLDVSIARCFAFVGKYLPRDQHFAIGNFIRDGLNNQPVVVTASSPVYRSYMHADDLARWLVEIGFAANPGVPIFNVGSDESISIQQLGKKIAHYFNVKSIIASPDNRLINRYVPSIAKAKQELGLTLQMNLDQAIDATIKSIKAV